MRILICIIWLFVTEAQASPSSLSIRVTSEDQVRTWSIEELHLDGNVQEYRYKHNETDYVIKLALKSWPQGRSYPARLDIYLETSQGEKIGGGFFSINNVEQLARYRKLGFGVFHKDKNYEIELIPSQISPGKLNIQTLKNEVLLLDVVSVPLQGFQMVRPVTLNINGMSGLSRVFKLDQHPFEVKYMAQQTSPGVVLFKAVLSKNDQAIHYSFFESASMIDFRTTMFVGRYFVEGNDFKVIFYPAKGQQ